MQPANSCDLFSLLEQVTDPRGQQGQRHTFDAMLAAIICGTLCGIHSMRMIAKWVRQLEPETFHWLGFKRTPPCANTYSDLLKVIDPEEFEQAIRDWIQTLEGIKIDDDSLRATSIDGKTLRGSLQSHERAVHLLSALDHETGYVLSQRRVDCKTNEAKAVFELFKTLVLKGKVIIGDAMFCQRDICEEIVDSGGDYFFTVKENQPTLLKEIKLAFAETEGFSPYQQREMEPDRDEHSTLNKGHGRVECRRLTSSTMLNKYSDWPGLKQVCQIIRTRTYKGETTTEVAYAVTSVGRDRVDAKTLLKWNRGHWGIENCLHWIRDETFGEDRCRVRTGAAPQVLAAIRNLAISWLRSQGIDTIAESLRENCWNPHRFFTKLGKPNF